MEKKKMCWVTWKKLTRSTREGGLGFRDIECFNDALLAKLSWKILTKPTCLIAKVLLSKYCFNSYFLEAHVPSSSHGWRGICIGKELLKTQLEKVVENGDNTTIWTDPWLSLETPKRPIGPAMEDQARMKVADLLPPTSKEWDTQKIRNILPHHEKEILEINISKLGAPDTWAWLPLEDGTYKVSSGYFEALKKEHVDQPQDTYLKDFNWKSNIWRIKSSPKTKLLLWKATLNAFPAGENLKNRQLNIDSKCPHCGEAETVVHLFFKCRFARHKSIRSSTN